MPPSERPFRVALRASPHCGLFLFDSDRGFVVEKSRLERLPCVERGVSIIDWMKYPAVPCNIPVGRDVVPRQGRQISSFPPIAGVQNDIANPHLLAVAQTTLPKYMGLPATELNHMIPNPGCDTAGAATSAPAASGLPSIVRLQASSVSKPRAVASPGHRSAARCVLRAGPRATAP